MWSRTLPMVVVMGVVVGLAPSPAEAPGRQAMRAAGAEPAVTRPVRPLAGVRIALDPGHQLGNENFPDEINRSVRAGAGGFAKACNTTGAETGAGLAEATIVWRIARRARARLERLGATVLLTRHRNSERAWGPCVDQRGRFGGRHHARLTVSIHADGNLDPSARGFHVIVPRKQRLVRPGILRTSRELGRAVRAGLDDHGLPRSNYIGRGTGLDHRADLGTLNLSRVPVVMVEIGNVHNPADAHRMSTRTGRQRYAAALVSGIRTYLEQRHLGP